MSDQDSVAQTSFEAKWLLYRGLYPTLGVLPGRVGYSAVARLSKWLVPQPPLHLVAERIMRGTGCSLSDALVHAQGYRQLMARNILDCYRMSSLDVSHPEGWLTLVGHEALRQVQVVGRGALVIISHFGRLSLLGAAFHAAGCRTGMLTTMVDERNVNLSPADRWFHSTNASRIQAHAQGPWITTGDSPREIFKVIQTGQTICISMDGLESNSSTRIRQRFLGGTVSLPEGILRIAERTSPVLFYARAFDRGARTHVVFEQLSDRPHDAMQKAIRLLESDVAREPWQWWHWPALDALWSPNPLTEAVA